MTALAISVGCLAIDILGSVIYLLDIVLRVHVTTDTAAAVLPGAGAYSLSLLALDVIATLPLDVVAWVWVHEWYPYARCLRLLKLHRVQSTFELVVIGPLSAHTVQTVYDIVPVLKTAFWLLVGLQWLGLAKNFISANPDPEPFGQSLYWTWAMIASGPPLTDRLTISPLEVSYGGFLLLLSLLCQGLLVARLSRWVRRRDVCSVARNILDKTVGILAAVCASSTENSRRRICWNTGESGAPVGMRSSRCCRRW